MGVAGHHRRPHRRRVGHASSTVAATSATSPSSSAPPTSTCRATRLVYLAILKKLPRARRRGDPRSPALRDLRRASTRRPTPGSTGPELTRDRSTDRRTRVPRRSPAQPVDAMLDEVVDRFLEVWEAEAGLKTYGAGGRRRHRVPRDEGETFDMSVDEWREFARTASFDDGPGAGRVDGHQHHLGLRAAQDARGLLPDPGRHRLRHRQVAGRRALRRHPVDGDEDRRSRRRPEVRRGDPRQLSRTRCWPTTCRRRSTGTRPG